jgi:hypothetical protein
MTGFADRVSVRLSRVAQLDHTYSAIVTIGLPCGADNALYLLRAFDGQVEILLAKETTELNHIREAAGALEYQLSKSDTGRVLVATREIGLWCSSNWHRLRWKVFQLTENGYSPLRLLEGEEDLFIGQRDALEMKLSQEEFRIRFPGPFRLQPTEVARIHDFHYDLGVHSADWIPAENDKPEYFLDNWLSLPWKTASEWVAPGRRKQLRDWHEQLNFLATRSVADLIEDTSVCQAREGDHNQWTVRLLNTTGSPKSPQIFVTIGRRKGRYVVESISSDRPHFCQGG